jgi:hypothetical protein
MSSSQLFRAVCGVGLGIAMFASAAQAQTEDKKTYFTFSGPIAVPGATLPAGRYLFRIADSTTGRRVIQVMSGDQKKSFAMMNTIPDTRREAAKDATVAFYETPKGTPAAVKSWWYPGERDGYQFIFPRTQAIKIAKDTGRPVLTTKTEAATSPVTHVDANGNDADAVASDDSTSTVFNRNTGSVASTEGDRTPPQAAPQPVPTTSTVARNELPRTASNLPLVGLIGMIAAFGFVTLQMGRSARG